MGQEFPWDPRSRNVVRYSLLLLESGWRSDDGPSDRIHNMSSLSPDNGPILGAYFSRASWIVWSQKGYSGNLAIGYDRLHLFPDSVKVDGYVVGQPDSSDNRFTCLLVVHQYLHLLLGNAD